MSKIITISLIYFLFLSFTSVAQDNGAVTGTVTDASTGKSLPGVNVVVQELQRGDATNDKGEYLLEDITPGTYTLVASFVGYTKFEEEFEIGSQQMTRNISLQPDILEIGEISVNALGFEVDADEQGTSSSRVSGDAITKSGETNVVSGLSAKAAGVNITGTSGAPGAASRIVIRGANTITGDNDPLFVIDGVPAYNSTVGASFGGVAQQSRINDINPADVKSVQILKGPSASALWGSRAANGVVLIETKSGEATPEGKVNITVKSELSIDQIIETADLQRSYGQGNNSLYDPTTQLSWGDKITGRSGAQNVVDLSNGNAYLDSNGEKKGLITQKNSRQTYNHADEIFDNGMKFDNFISISGGDNSGNFYLSASNLNQDGIIKSNSSYNRTTVRGNATKYFNKLTATVNAQYTNVTSDRMQRGSNVSGLVLGAYRTPPDFNQKPYTVNYIQENGSILTDRHRSYQNPVGESRTATYNNPFWTLENIRNNSGVRRIQGSTELSYDPTDWFNVTHRLGLDSYSDRRFEIFPIYDSSNPSGALTEQEVSQFQVNSDLIFKATHTVNENYSGSLLFGWNLNHRNTDQVGATSTDIILEGFNRDLSNYSSTTPFQDRRTIRTSALYSVLNFNAYDMLYLKLTARQESASTFGQETDQSFFYPSASLAWQFTELNAFSDSNILNFGKLRISYGEAGVQPPPYRTITNFVQEAFEGNWGDALQPAEYGGGFGRSEIGGNQNLKVERTKEFEIGADLRLFSNRLNLSLTGYATQTEDAILNIDRPPSSGFSSRTANAASIENQGLEAELNIELIRSQDFIWSWRGTWSKNISEVTSLEGAERVILNGVATQSAAVEGEEYGVLIGNRWRDINKSPITEAERENGFQKGENDFVLDSNGFPVVAAERGIIGNPNPDWSAGLGSTVSYKNITFDFLIDIRKGGDVANDTKGALYNFGTHGDQVWESTAQQDLTTFDDEIISAGTTFRGYIKDFGAGPVAVEESYFVSGPGSNFGGSYEPFIEDGGFVRLRSASISYNFSSSNFRNTTGLKSINLTLTGRNLFLITDYSGIDPEVNLTGPSNGFGLDYFTNPSTRSLIFSISVNY